LGLQSLSFLPLCPKNNKTANKKLLKTKKEKQICGTCHVKSDEEWQEERRTYSYWEK